MQLDDTRPKEDALESHDYREDEMEQSGTLPDDRQVPKISIKLAKHHVISWKILREAWNKADRLGKNFICVGIYKVLNNTEIIPADEETVRKNVCWSRSNLIIGPEGNIRLFDPGELLDFEAPSSILPNARERVDLLLALGALLMQYRDDKGSDTPTWTLQFNNAVQALSARYMDICSFDRSAWKLFTKAQVVWGISGASNAPEVKQSIQGFWYRGCVSAQCVARLFPEGMPTKKHKIGISKDGVKGDRLKDLKQDLQQNRDARLKAEDLLRNVMRKRAARLDQEKLAKEALDNNDQPAMVLATDELRK
ncbi:MAG TPA: hypothetical protein PK306_13130 [Aquabacterium sp.]|nr:hypothetical protein [Aquabacterium sp.]HQC96644.1 hypothetical protein [Aquabacterium sp.]